MRRRSPFRRRQRQGGARHATGRLRPTWPLQQRVSMLVAQRLSNMRSTACSCQGGCLLASRPEGRCMPATRHATKLGDGLTGCKMQSTRGSHEHATAARGRSCAIFGCCQALLAQKAGCGFCVVTTKSGMPVQCKWSQESAPPTPHTHTVNHQPPCHHATVKPLALPTPCTCPLPALPAPIPPPHPPPSALCGATTWPRT